MIKLIIIFIFVLSITVMAVMIFQKIPILVQLPQISESQKKKEVLNKLKNKLNNFFSFQSLNFEIILQKMLSKIRVLILKLENKTFFWLQNLRQKSQKKKLINENYWQDLKKSARNKKTKDAKD